MICHGGVDFPADTNLSLFSITDSTESYHRSGERLEWMFWVDRDTIILDSCRSLLSFLPAPARQQPNETGPDPAEEVHFLATRG